jgi:hypothetical protein
VSLTTSTQAQRKTPCGYPSGVPELCDVGNRWQPWDTPKETTLSRAIIMATIGNFDVLSVHLFVGDNLHVRYQRFDPVFKKITLF